VNLIAAFLKSRTAANVLMLGILGLGVLAATRIRRETFPSSDLDTLKVTARYPGASPDEVESTVLTLIEEQCTGIKGMKSVSGTASEGRAAVTVELREGTDMSVALAELRDRIGQITGFPETIEDVVVSELRRRDRVMTLVVHGDVPEAIVRLHAFRLRDELITGRIATEVTVEGAREPEIHITASEAKLLERGITVDDVARAVSEWSQDAPLGTVRTARGDILLRVSEQRRAPREFLDIPVARGAGGQEIALGAVARVSRGWEEVDLGAGYAGSRAAIVQVDKTGDQDTTRIAEAIQRRLIEFGGTLPEAIKVDVFTDQSARIRERLGILVENGALGLVLVFLVLLFFTELRVAFWVTWGIPVVFLGTIFVMWVLGYTINMITMFGLVMVLGMLVDDAVVIAENIFARLKQGATPREASLKGSTEVFWPVIASSLTTIGAFVPLMFVAGRMGRTMGALPWVVIAALIASGLEAFLSMPKHLEHALGRVQTGDGGDEGRPSWAMRVRGRLTAIIEQFVERTVGPATQWLLKERYLVLGVAAGLLIATVGVVAGGRLQFTFFPTPDTNSLVARVRFPVGGPPARTERQIAMLKRALADVEAELGSGVKGDGPLIEKSLVRHGETSVHTERGGHLAQMQVELRDAELRNVTSDKVIASWRRHAKRVPGVSALTIGRLERGVGGRELDIRLVGGSWEELADASAFLQAGLASQVGVSNIESDLRPGKAEIVLGVSEEGRRLGLTTATLAQQVRAAFYGSVAQRFHDGRDDVTVRVHYPTGERLSIEDMRQMTVALPSPSGGVRIPLARVARLGRARGWAELAHLDRQRTVAVTADIDERVTTAGEVVAALNPLLRTEIPRRFPGVAVRLEGQRATQRETFANLAVGAMVGILIVIAVLVLVTDSWSAPLFILAVVPFGLVGAVFGHLVMGYKMTMLGTMAAIGLAGVVVNDAILVMEFYRSARREHVSPSAALVDAVKRRFRPIMMTTVTTVAGLVPMLMETSIQAQFLIPMAITLAFGLAAGTLGTLVVLPAALLIAEDVRGVGDSPRPRA